METSSQRLRMTLPISSCELVQFLDSNLTKSDKHALGFGSSLFLISANKDMADWAIENAERIFYDDGFVALSRKHLAASYQGDLSKIEAMPCAKWLSERATESKLHYFWLGMNHSEEATGLLESRARSDIVDNEDSGIAVWMSVACSHPRPEVLQVVYDKYTHKSGGQYLFDPAIRATGPSTIHLGKLAANPSATSWVLKNLEQYLHSSDEEESSIWKGLSSNPHPDAIAFLRKYPLRIDKTSLCANPSKEAMGLLQKLWPNPDNWNWSVLSTNPAAISFLQEGSPDFESLGTNPHPWAIQHFAKWVMSHPDKRSLKKPIRAMFRYNYWDEYMYQWI